MSDFMKTLEAKSDQINNPDLSTGPMDITIVDFMIKLSDSQPVSIKVQETNKYYRPSKGMRRLIAKIWGGDVEKFKGRKIRIYQDPDVNFGKDKTGGIRISHMSDIDRVHRVVIPVSRNRYKEYVVEPLQVETQAHKHDPSEVQDEARDAARGGKEAFTAWWKANPDKRDAAKAIMDELKTIAADADKPEPAPEVDEDEIPM